MIGLDKDGNQVAVGVPEESYSQQMSAVFSAVQESTMAALAKRPTNQSWMLREVIVGAGIQLDAGLGPIIGVSTKPRVRVVFTNTSNLFFP